LTRNDTLTGLKEQKRRVRAEKPADDARTLPLAPLEYRKRLVAVSQLSQESQGQSNGRGLARPSWDFTGGAKGSALQFL
jgi:hypothetical protein